MACDRPYLYPWAVGFLSLHRWSDRPFDFWFGLARDWHTRISSEQVEQVLQLVSALGTDSQTVEVAIETGGLPSDSYISPTAFVKLGLLDLCPVDAQMVWFDSDLVARAPWNGLLDQGSGHAISGNHEVNPDFENRWFGNTCDSYVNTGVLAIEGHLWLESYGGKWRDYVASYSQYGFRYLDQDVLNATVRTNWNLIEDRYNFRPIHNHEWADPAIIHFSGRYKPWLRTGLQTKLLRGVWGPAFQAYAEAEADFLELLDDLPDNQRRFWLEQRSQVRGFMGLAAWRKYLEVTLQGVFKLN